MGTPNTAVIEMTAVNKLKDSLLRTEQVEPDVRDNDKTPSWDGELRVYSEKSFNKNFLLGKIPIQVKGKWVSSIQGSSIKYDVSVNDLKNYLNDGGVIFFVVHMKDFDDFKIYYNSLLPFDLRKIISQAEGQATKRIKLEQFPSKYRDGMMRILIGFLQDKKKQGTLLPNIRSMEDLKKSNMEIEQFTFSVPRIGSESEEELFENMLNSEQFIYAKPKGIEASFAIDKIHFETITQKMDVPIVVNGETVYTGFSVVRSLGGTKTIELGEGVTIQLSGHNAKFNFEFNGTLHDQISEITLILALIEKQQVLIGTYVMEGGNYDFRGHTLEELKERLSELKKIDQTLKLLHIKKDLNLGKLTNDELNLLNSLIGGIYYKKPVHLNLNSKVGVGKLVIGNLKIILSSKDNTDGNGVFISNFFESDGLILAESGKDPSEGAPISPYVVLRANEFEAFDNIDFDQIVDSIKKFPYTKVYGTRITFFILELLKYYDSHNDAGKKILDIAETLIDFLEENDKESEELHHINRLQIAKRKRKLANEEIRYLMSMKEAGFPLQYQLAANILLESFHEANIIYEQLDAVEQKMFDDYPIANLWCRT